MQVHKLLIFNLFCILSISCTPIVEGPERNSLDVNFCIESGSSPAVRSIIPTSNENAVHNVALACYNSSGELVGAMFIDEGNISASISLTYPNNYHIYALGNCSLSEDRLTRQYPREDDIKEFEYRIDDYASLDSGGFPMSTSFYLSINENAALSIVNDGSEGSYINDGGIVICLKRLVCRYLFQLDKSELPDDYRYTVKALRIANAASKVSPFAYLSSEGSRAEGPGDLISGDYALDIDLEAFNNGEIVCFYCLENCQEVDSPFATTITTEAEINCPGNHTILGNYSSRLGFSIGHDCLVKRGKEYYLSIVAGSSTDSDYSVHYFSYIYDPAKYVAQNSYLYCADNYQVSALSGCKLTNLGSNTYRITPRRKGEYAIQMTEGEFIHTITRTANDLVIGFDRSEYPLLIDGYSEMARIFLCGNSPNIIDHLTDIDADVFALSYGDILLSFPPNEIRFGVENYGRSNDWIWYVALKIRSYTDYLGNTASSPSELESYIIAHLSGADNETRRRIRAKGLFEGLGGVPPTHVIDFRDSYLPPSASYNNAFVVLTESVNIFVDTDMNSFNPSFETAAASYTILNDFVRIPYSDHSFGRYPIYADIFPYDDESSIMHLIIGYAEFRRHFVFGGMVDDVESNTWVSVYFKGNTSGYFSETNTDEFIHCPEEYGGLNYYAETVSEDFFRQWGYNVEQFKRLYPCRIYIYDPQTNDRVSSSPGGWHDESGIYLSPYIYLHRIDDEDIRGTLAPWQDYNANGWI